MRKILAILAFCCLFFIVGGYSLLYRVRLAEIKADVKKQLLHVQKSQLTELVFTDAEFAALDREDDAEIRYGQTMYDVVKIETTDGKTRCWCLPDDKETALADQYLKTQVPSEKSPSQSLVKLLKVPFLSVTVLQQDTDFSSSPVLFMFYSSSFSSLSPRALAPPPKFC